MAEHTLPVAATDVEVHEPVKEAIVGVVVVGDSGAVELLHAAAVKPRRSMNANDTVSRRAVNRPMTQ